MTKKLYRSRKDKVIGGVCGGIGEYFGIDPTIVRIAFLLILFARGAGLLAYIIAWVVIPERPTHINEEGKEVDVVDIETDSGEGEEEPENNSEPSEVSATDKQKLFGVILVVLGGIFLVDIWLPGFYWRRFWPLVIIALGAGILLKGARSNEQKQD